MKRLDRLILKSFLGPLALTFAIAVFVLLMQFVWKYVDDLVGKGLEFRIIAELMLYASATFVPMALPISVLFASIMTMGNFGEKYELVAMKAGGISVRRVMMPMLLIALLLTGVAFFFANNVLPKAMYQYRTILYDVQRKKPAVSIRPSTYYTEIDGYVIRVNGKDPDGQTLRDIIIYDHTQGIRRTSITVAKRGFMETTPDNCYLLFSLYNGFNYSEPSDGADYTTRPHTSIGFDEQVLTFDISSFAFSKSEDDYFEHHYQMLNVHQLDSSVTKLQVKIDTIRSEYARLMLSRFRAYQTAASDSAAPYLSVAKHLDTLPQPNRGEILRQARTIASAGRDDANLYRQILSSEKEYINRHYIEWMRKFTLSVACLLLFLIGAPFGSIVRKGGLGLPLVASVLFFVLYYVIGMISEKSVREGATGPIGMWVATFVFIPIGAVLTWVATTDSSIFDLSAWKKFFSFRRHLSGRRNSR